MKITVTMELSHAELRALEHACECDGSFADAPRPLGEEQVRMWARSTLRGTLHAYEADRERAEAERFVANAEAAMGGK